MQFTPEQQTAVYTHDKNLVVVAGAGSGKTRVLVERYLALLEAYPDWSLTSLVAITFTKEAALEMTNRVRLSLENKLNEAPSEQKMRWQMLLAQMDSARIATIHSLCGDILRANAALIGLDPGFEVMDPVNASILLDDVITDVLNDIAQYDSHGLLRLFTEYDERSIRSMLRNSDLLALDLQQLGHDPSVLLAAWQAQWAQSCDALRQQALNLIDNYAYEPLGDDSMSKAWQVVSDACAVLVDENCEAQIIYDVVQQCDASIKLPGNPSKKVWGEDAGVVKENLRAFREDIRACLVETGEKPDQRDAYSAELLVLWCQLLERVQSTYSFTKQRDSLLDFNDLEVLTARLLTTYPQVRARYCNNEFRHVLVDEFQDTNSPQWQIVQSLTTLDKGGSLFVVGDPKQSIYGFRGADVSVFESVREIIASRDCGQEVALSQSFRSHSQLVNSFNALFQQLLTRDESSPVSRYQVRYDRAMSAFRADVPNTPTLQLLLLNDQLPDEGGRAKSIGVDARRPWEAYEIGQRIQQMIGAQTPVFDKETGQHRSMRYGDVAILLRQMTHVTQYEDVFKVLGIPYVTLAGRGYYDRQEVWDVLNLLRVLYNKGDNLSLAAALRSPLFGFSDDLLLALRLLKYDDSDKVPMPLWDALAFACREPVLGVDTNESKALVAFTYRVLCDLKALAGRVSIAELIREALARTGYLAVLQALSPDGPRRRRNVEKLVQIAEESGKIALSDFTAYMDDISSRDLREGEALLDASDAVRLMTVHGSKGLEFPVVILADTGSSSGRNDSPLLQQDAENGLACKITDGDGKWYKPYPYRQIEMLQALREEAENRRLLYVAATRAQDYLLISGHFKQKNETFEADHWLGLLLQALKLNDCENGALLPVPDTDDCYVYATVHQYDPELPSILVGGTQEAVSLDTNASPQSPALMAAIPKQPTAAFDHMNASQLESLLAAVRDVDHQRREMHQANLMAAIADAPKAPVREIVRMGRPQLTGRIIGSIVHEALRYWRLPDNTPDLEHVLRGYAWDQGVTDSVLIEQAAQEANRLLRRFMHSELYQWVTEAKALDQPVYHELPFIYQLEDHLVHGLIDLVFQRSDGQWCIVDFKTHYVESASLDTCADHAYQHFCLQMGAYAQAMMSQFSGIEPQVYVHYVRYTYSIAIDGAAWRAAIDSLNETINTVLS